MLKHVVSPSSTPSLSGLAGERKFAPLAGYSSQNGTPPRSPRSVTGSLEKKAKTIRKYNRTTANSSRSSNDSVTNSNNNNNNSSTANYNYTDIHEMDIPGTMPRTHPTITETSDRYVTVSDWFFVCANQSFSAGQSLGERAQSEITGGWRHLGCG